MLRTVFLKCLLLSLCWFCPTLSFACEQVTTARIAVFEQHHIPQTQSPSYSLSWILLSHAAQKECIQLKPEALPWTASIGKVRNGEIDLVFGTIKTPAREKWAVFSTPLGNTSSILQVVEDSPIQSWQDVDTENMVVAATRNSAHWELAAKLGFKNRYHIIPKPDILPIMQRGRIDLLLSSPGVTYNVCRTLKENNQPCLRDIQQFLLAGRNHVITEKRNKPAKALIARLNRGLRTLYNDPSLLDGVPLTAQQRQVYESWRTHMATIQSE